MIRQFFLSKPLEDNKGFSLIEVLINISLISLLTIFIGETALQFTANFKTILDRIEEEENLLSSVNALFQMVRYSQSLQVSPDGKKLTIDLASQPIEIYPQGKSLLIKNQGVANPIAEGCIPEEISFFLTEEGNGRKMVEATLVFGDKLTSYLQLNPFSSDN